MTGRKTQLPPGTEVDDQNRLVLPKPKPRDASQKKRWKSSKKVRVAKRAKFNSIGK